MLAPVYQESVRGKSVLSAIALTSRSQSRSASRVGSIVETFPERLLVVGGGYIAVEFAGIFNGLGAQVTQLYRRPLFLRALAKRASTT